MDHPFDMISRLRDTADRVIPTEHLVWVEIVRRAHTTQNPTIVFRSADLADKAGVSRRRLTAALAGLVNHGLIDYTPNVAYPDQRLTLRNTTSDSADDTTPTLIAV